MCRDFDIFEKFPDGSSLWRVCVSGGFEAQRKVHDLTEHSDNEFYAIDIQAGEMLRFNLAGSNSREHIKSMAKRVA
jgi:hypothetical protein